MLAVALLSLGASLAAPMTPVPLNARTMDLGQLVGTWNVRTTKLTGDSTCVQVATTAITSTIWLMSADPGATEPGRKILVTTQGESAFPALAGAPSEGMVWLSGFAAETAWGEAGWSYDLVPHTWFKLRLGEEGGRATLTGTRHIARVESLPREDRDDDVKLRGCVEVFEVQAVKQ